jgi:transposase
LNVPARGEASLAQIGKDFGISESCLHRWVKLADIEDGIRPGATVSESTELRELRKRNRLLEQENEILCRALPRISRSRCHSRSARRSRASSARSSAVSAAGPVGLVNPVRLRCLRVFVDQSAENRVSLDSCGGEVDDLWWWVWWSLAG